MVFIWTSKKEIKGIIQISHGMAEHKERYIPFMNYMANAGFVSVIHDHKGHGESIKNKEDLGYFYDTKIMIVEDLHQVTLYIKDKYPKLLIILFGHSMGSMVVRVYLKDYDKDINALIVCGSPSKNNGAKVALSLIKFMELFHKDTYRSKFINYLAFHNYNKDFESNSSNSWLTSDDVTVKEYDTDPLCGYIFTLNGFYNLFSLMEDIYQEEGYQVKNSGLPILFLAGEKDPVIMNTSKWREAQEFLKKIGYQNITNKLYPDMRHELLNELNKEQVYEDILHFAQKSIS